MTGADPDLPKTSIELVQVTPDVAKGWLDTVPGIAQYLVAPRRLVYAHAKAMRLGKWELAGHDPIKLDPDGVLVDGKLRLEAVRRAGVTVPMFVMTGVTPEILAELNRSMDRAAPRRLPPDNSL